MARRRTTKGSRPADTAPADDLVISTRALARAVDRSEATVRGWYAYDTWELGKPSRGNPLQVSTVIAWMHANLSKGPDDVGGAARDLAGDLKRLDPLKQVRVAKLHQEVKKLRLQNEILQSTFIDRAEAQREIRAAIIYYRTVLLAEPRAIADGLDAKGLLADDARDAVEAFINRRIEGLCDRFATRMTDAVD